MTRYFLLPLALIIASACTDGSNRSQAVSPDNVSATGAQTSDTRISLVEAAAWDFQSKLRGKALEDRKEYDESFSITNAATQFAP